MDMDIDMDIDIDIDIDKAFRAFSTPGSSPFRAYCFFLFKALCNVVNLFLPVRSNRGDTDETV